jgi:hypothetical protein
MKFRQTILGLAGSLTLAMGAFYALHYSERNSFHHHFTAPVARTPATDPAKPTSVCEDFYRSVCMKKGITKDPSGTVARDFEGELQALRMQEQIIHLHPEWTGKQVDDELADIIYTPEKKKRFQSAYNLVKKTLKKIIDRQPDTVLNPKIKKILKKRINDTYLELPPPAALYADEPDLFTKNDVFYERTQDGHTRMRIGGAYLLTVKSWFNMLFTMGHEFAHSIDPCEIKALGLHIEAYDRLTSCFMQNGLIAKTPERAECGEKDQLSETFADWFGVQVTADALRAFSTEFKGPQVINAAKNAVRDLCEQDEIPAENSYDFHPPPEVRIEKIFAQQPEIREVLGCPATLPSTDYCHF